MQDTQKESFRIYFAGASLAFGIPFLAFELLGILYGGSPEGQSFLRGLSTLYVLLNAVGGVLGGYLAARRSGGDLLQVGTLTGVLAYILQQVIYMILYQGMSLGDAFSMIGLIGGSVFGAQMYKSRLRLRRLRGTGRVESGERPSEEEDEAEEH